MAIYNLIEHAEAKRILEAAEKSQGFLERFRVSVPEGSVHTTFAEMPAKEYEVFRVDIDGEALYLVPNEMDDYARYQPLPLSVFCDAPVFLGTETPFSDQKLNEARERVRVMTETKARNESSHVTFFEAASEVNRSIPGFFDIPETLPEYIDAIGSKFSEIFNLDADLAQRANDVVGKYKSITGEEKPNIDFNENSCPRTKLYKLINVLEGKSFEKDYGFSIEAEVIDGSMLSMKALNPKGGVLEQVLVSIEDGVSYFDESPEKVQVLDLCSMENVYKRYGKHVDYEESLLAIILDQYEDSYFEMTDKPSLPEYDDDGTEVLALSSLQAPAIYKDIRADNENVAQKLSLVSKVSLDKTVNHKVSSPAHSL